MSRLISKYLRAGRLSSVHCRGCPRKTLRYEDTLIKRVKQEDPTTSSAEIRTNLSLNISERTIRRRDVEAGLFKILVF